MSKIHERPARKRTESPIPMRIRQLTTEQSAQLIAGYLAGVPVKEMAAEYGIHRSSVSKHLREHGVPPRQVGLNEDQIQQAVTLYGQGDSLETIGKRFGVDSSTVHRRLKERSVVTRSPYEHLL